MLIRRHQGTKQLLASEDVHGRHNDLCRRRSHDGRWCTVEAKGAWFLMQENDRMIRGLQKLMLQPPKSGVKKKEELPG